VTVSSAPMTTLHRPVIGTLSAASELISYHFHPVVSPISLAGGLPATAAVTQTGNKLFVSWNADTTIGKATPSTSGPAARTRPAAPSAARGYAVTDQLTDLPFQASTNIAHTDRTLTYRGKDAVLSTYLHDGYDGRWLSWALEGGHDIHAWLANAPDDSTIESFADSLLEQPQTLSTELSPALTLRGLTAQSVSTSADPQALVRSTVALCPIGVVNPATNDAPACLYVQALSSYTTGGPCSDPHAPSVQVPVSSQNVIACPTLQQATLYVAGQSLETGQNIFIQAPKSARLSAADLAALAVAATMTA